MKNSFKVSNALACEHVIDGVNKKHTLINTYAGNILLAEFPAKIFLAFYVEFISNAAYETEAEISLHLGRKVAMRGALNIKFDGINPLVLAIPAGVLQVEKPTRMKLMITPSGGKAIKLIEKELMPLEGQASPIASPLPS